MPIKILIIENDPDMQEALHTILDYSGYQVMVASGADQGLKLAVVEQPAVICSDLMLNPTLTGIDFLKQKQQIPEIAAIPVIVITGVTETALIDSIYQYGAFAHVTKPFSRKELDELLHRALANSRYR